MNPEELVKIKELMLARSLTLAVAESLTSGNLQATVGSISGASNFFEGGLTAYNIDQKVRHLGVDRAAAERCDCVSAEIAEQMAVGVAERFESDLGIGTTGYAEPYPQEGVVRPYAFFAICRRERPRGACRKVASGRPEWTGLSRVEVQRALTREVLRALIGYLEP